MGVMTNLKSYCILFLGLFCHNVYAQQGYLDSLKNALDTATTPQIQSQLSAKIGNEYYKKQTYLDSAYFYVNQAYTLAKNNKLIKEQAAALSIRGNVNSYFGDHNIAINDYKEAVKLFYKLKDAHNLFGNYNNMGASYFELKEYDAAIENYYKALAMAQKEGDKILVAIATMNIAETLFVNKKYEPAKLKFEESLSILKETNFNPPTVHLFYARTLKALGELAEAENEGIASFNISEQQQDFKYASQSAQFLSDVYEEQAKYEKALAFQKKQISYAEKINRSKEKNEIEKIELNYELKEKNEQLAFAAQKENFMKIIWILVSIGVLLLILLIYRQVKITRMTRGIHDIQKRLVETELIIREKKIKKTHPFKADKNQDIELL